MKNAVICLVTIVSRMVIQFGVSTEKSFSMSDYFIFTVEEKRSLAELEELLQDIFSSYSDLLRSDSVAFYSKNITRAIQFIQEHLYESCTVTAIASHLSLNARYFSGLFKSEVGLSPSSYIKQQKLEEARRLLSQRNLQVGEVAELLGFCSSSHFSAEFKRAYGESPQRYKLYQR